MPGTDPHAIRSRVVNASSRHVGTGRCETAQGRPTGCGRPKSRGFDERAASRGVPLGRLRVALLRPVGASVRPVKTTLEGDMVAGQCPERQACACGR